jgi:5-methylcytosine-specific restriction endonuclease McrA
MNPFYAAAAQRANHRCEYCHAPELVFNFPFEVEHVIPLARKGANDETNLALACCSCNLRKGTRVSALLLVPMLKCDSFMQDMTDGMNISRPMLNLA